MKNRFVPALILTAIFAIPAAGQIKSADPGKVENIRRLLKLTKGEDVQQLMTEQVLAALKPMFSSSPAEDARAQKMFNRFSTIVGEEFRKIDFIGITISLYDKYFTNDEILGLIRFYETPLGQKATQVLPSLVQESMARGQEQGQHAAARAISRLAEEYPELRNVLQRLP
jgi:hypothetical protein